jgi:nicotinate-nucleotide pyrophosphorylase (carboxylating)
MLPTDSHVDALLKRAFDEDIGRGDITTLSLGISGNANFAIITKESLVVCGTLIASRAFTLLDAHADCVVKVEEGEAVAAGTVLLSGEASIANILAAERTALNLLQYLSGIASFTQQCVTQLEGTNCRLLDTRKTLPGLRLLAKYAVRVGGGKNHRFGLDDGVLIKDNHLALGLSLSETVARARAHTPLLTKIAVECDTLTQVEEALGAGVDHLLLDNMSIAELQEAVRLVAGRIPLEASGGVTLATLRAIADTGVNFISMGRLTHSVMAKDISLELML